MRDDEIVGILNSEIDRSLGGRTSALTGLWREALDRYHGQPTGTELPGQSRAVSTDLADAVTWIMPELIRVFVDERVCVARGNTPQSSEQEDDIAAALNHIFYDADEGRATAFLHSFIQDACLQMNGIGKVRWDETEKVERWTLDGATQDDVIMALNQPGVSVAEVDENGARILDSDEPEGDTPRYTVLEKRTTVRSPEYMAIPPEEFVISQDASCLDVSKARFCAHYRPMMAGDIVEQYELEPEFVESLPDFDWLTGNRVGDTEVSYARDRLDVRDSFGAQSNTDKSTVYKAIYECYPLIDVDGDGIPERWQFVISGNHILDRQAWDGDPPFFSSSPFPEPHMFYGMSLFDKLREVQSAKTALLRQLEDNNALINNPQREVVTGQVNPADLKTRRPGSYIRSKVAGSVINLPVQQFGAESYAALDYHDRLIQRRTGVTPGDAEMSMPVGGNTAHGVERLMSAKEEVQWLISKLIGETGIRCMFRLLFDMLRRDGEPIMLRDGEEWQQIDPRQWPEDMTIGIRGAAGLGTRMRDATSLQTVIQYQGAMLDRGLGGVMVTEKGVYRAIEDWQKAVGLMVTRGYFQDPESREALQAQQAKNEQQAQQARIQEQQAALGAQIVERKQAIEEAKLRQKAINDRANVALDFDKLINDQEQALTELELKYGQNVPGALV